MPALPEAEGQVSDLICCICPYPRGSVFYPRAVRCAEMQSYSNVMIRSYENIPGTITVGTLRNIIIETTAAEYICHIDHDDVSATDRLSCQLAHIQKTGKLVTGFYSMPMYDAKNDKVWIYENADHRFALGTSLFYKREAWERVKFPDKTPEDNEWRRWVGYDNCESQSVFREDGTPMMVQVVHGGNASARIVPSDRKKFKEASEAQEKAVRELLASA